MAWLSIAEKTWFVDVMYQGLPRLIACGVLETDDGLVLVDPGPTSSLATLRARLAEQGASFRDVHAVLLTHIHLDHAGATGSIVDEYPEVQVYVHRIGAQHLIRPERLLASAQRLYGDMMDQLWGAFLAVPEANVHRLEGAEVVEIGGRTLKVAYTPGHAIHHVSYFDEATGSAFVGDTAGVGITGVNFVVPIAPPPDIDLEGWYESLHTIRTWQPRQLFLTHFGPSEQVASHLDVVEHKLRAWSDEIREMLEDDRDDNACAAAFHAEKMAVMRSAVSGYDQAPYERMGQPRTSWYGIARYWRKRAQNVAAEG